jgi:hypothetical protein
MFPEYFAQDVVPLLELLAAKLNKTKAELAIYDPYYCAGAVKIHLGRLGFPNVYNECENFYERLKVRAKCCLNVPSTKAKCSLSCAKCSLMVVPNVP